MTNVHGKLTAVTLNGVDYSQYANATDFKDATDTHETTTYGRDRKTYKAGLGDGTVSVGGFYDSTKVTGPRGLFKPIKAAGTEVEFVYRPEGTGSGKAQSRVNVIIASFEESSPVGDMVTWTSELQMTGPLDETDQV
jgi:hypothetical protein